jgi:Protein of unknown function (DUF4013)
MKPVPVSAAFDVDVAVKRFFADPDWMFKTGLGGVLTAACMLIAVMDPRHLFLLPVSLAIAAVLCGFLLRVTRLRISKPDAPRIADWGDWGDLFMSGITWIAIQFGINVLACGMISVALILAFYSLATPGAFTTAIAETALLVSLLVILWTSFLSTYLWVNFAVEECVPGGLALRKVTRVIRKRPAVFWIAWALSCALQIVAVIVPAVTVIGVFLIPTTLFASQIVSAHLLALAWSSSDIASESAKAA